MDKKTPICLYLLSSAVVFYWHLNHSIKSFLDLVPAVPKLTKPFERIIEIVTYPSDSDSDIIELPRISKQQPIEPDMIFGEMPMHQFGMTIVIESGHIDPLMHNFIGRMLGAPIQVDNAFFPQLQGLRGRGTALTGRPLVNGLF